MQNTRPLPGPLERLRSEYNTIVDAWSAGTISPEEGSARLDELIATDAAGVMWRINPATAAWQSTASGDWADDDPYTSYTEDTTVSDDFSRTSGPAQWGAAPPAMDLSAWETTPDVDGFEGGMPLGRGPQPAEPTAFGGWEPPSAASFGEESKPARSGGGVLSGITGALYAIWDRIAALPRWAQGAGALLLVGAVAFMFLSGGGCGGGNYTLSQVAEADQEAARCVINAGLFHIDIDPSMLDGDDIEFGPDVAVTYFQLSQHMGATYQAVSGSFLSMPAPPDADDINGNSLARNTAITAWAAGLIGDRGGVTSTGAATRGEAIEAIGRFYYGLGDRTPTDAGEVGAAGERNQARYLASLIADGVLTASELVGPMPEGMEELDPALAASELRLDAGITRIELARYLTAAYKAGLKVAIPSLLDAEIPENEGEAPSTTPEVASEVPNGDDIAALVAAISSGDRQVVAAAIKDAEANPYWFAINTARFAGYRENGIAIRFPAGAEKDEEGRVIATVEYVDTNTSEVIARGNARFLAREGRWIFAGWPTLEVVELEEG